MPAATEEESAVIGRRRLVPASLPFLIALTAAVGCGGGPAGLGGEHGEPDEAPLGGAYVLAGFGEGSLWATDVFVCDDTGWAPPWGGAASCGSSADEILKRLDSETGEEEAAVELEGFSANVTEVAFGAGSVWVSSADYYPGPVEERQPWDAIYRVDPETNRLISRIPVDSPSGVTFGHGSAWAVSAGHGTVSRIDPDTGEVVAKIEVGRGAVDVASDERGGAVWVAGLHFPEDHEERPPPKHSGARKLTRVDPETNEVVAEIPVEEATPYGGASGVAVGEGAVWAQSGGGDLLKVDARTNRVVASVPLGDYSTHLAVSGGSVWATGQDHSGTWLKRVDPRAVEVVRTRDLGPADSGGYGRLAADAMGRVWFVEGGAWTGEGEGTLTRISP